MIIRDALGWIVAAIGVLALIAGIIGVIVFTGSVRFVTLGAGIAVFLVAAAITYLRRD